MVPERKYLKSLLSITLTWKVCLVSFAHIVEAFRQEFERLADAFTFKLCRSQPWEQK